MSSWSSPGVARIAELIRDRTGLVFPQARAADVESAIARAMRRRGVKHAWEFADLLDHDGRARDAIVAELTVGETYFYRDPAQFALLRTRLLPALLDTHHDRPIRAWSAGCASGEEPYSIAMLLDELGGGGRADITGTDISRPRLGDAQRGLYSRWSLRALEPELQERFFTPRGRYFELRDEIRSTVDFRYLNLAEDRFPSLSGGIWGMDLILCRNVLIYFDTATVELVARRLIASLSEDGYLVLGASDPPIAEMVECDVVVTDAGLVYRRVGAGPGAVGGNASASARASGGEGAALQGDAGGGEAGEASTGFDELSPPVDMPSTAPTDDAHAPALPSLAGDEPAPSAPMLLPLIAEAYARRDFESVRVTAARAAATGNLNEGGWACWLRALANQGCLDEAMEVAERAVRAVGPTPELLYLTAVLQLQAGQPALAAGTARRALYLDRGLIVAHMTQAEAQRRLGNRDAARRALRNAGELLGALPRDTIVHATDGESAGRLAELVRVKLRLIGAAG